MVTARDIMTGDATCARTTETLRDAARKMRDLDVGALPICGEDDRLAGMITDRDIVVRCVADGKAQTVTEIIPKTGFYDYEAKYGDDGSEHVVPADLPRQVIEKCLNFAERAHAVLDEVVAGGVHVASLPPSVTAEAVAQGG